MSDKIIVVDPGGVNAVEIGKHTVYVVKSGEQKVITLKKEASWVWIPVEFLETAKKLGDTTVSFKEWGNWLNKTAQPIHKFGIGKQTVISKRVGITVTKEQFLNGTILYAEAFYDYPKFEKGFYIAAADEPKILSAYFANYKDEYKYPGEKDKSSTHTYKSAVKLFITTHLIPDYTLGYHNFALFEIDIYRGDTKVTDTPLKFYQGTNPNKFSVNTISELTIPIDEAWRGKEPQHEEGEVDYYAKITTTIYSREIAKVDDHAFDLNNNDIISGGDGQLLAYLKFRNKFGTVAPNGDIVAVTLTPELYKKFKLHYSSSNESKIKKASKVSTYATKTLEPVYSTIENNTVLKNQEVSFTVRYDDMEVILDNYEASKNNMFVVVGDVAYSKKNNESCKFSAIEVKTEGRESPITLFDEEVKETKAFFDKTEIAIGIVAGEEKQTVTITAKGLATEFHNSRDVKCLGITSSKTVKKGAVKFNKVKHKKEEEFKHDSIKKVFNMNYAYILFPENRMVSTNLNNSTTGSETIEIGKQNVTYKHNADFVDLEIEYFYNKTLNLKIENWLKNRGALGKWCNEKLEFLWVINYFGLYEDQAQRYFVPVQTCRYPNQMVLLKVYPEINWGITFGFGLSDEKYKLDWRKDLSDEKKKLIEGIKKEVDDDLKPYDHKNKLDTETKDDKILNKYNFQLSAKASYDTTVVDLTPGYKGEMTQFILKILKAKEFIDEITGNSFTEKEKQEIYNKRKKELNVKFGKKEWFKNISKLPITIMVFQPKFDVGMAWGREPLDITNGYGAPVKYDLFIKASPLFGVSGSLDLITCAGFLPVAGQAIKVADIVLKVVGVEPVFTLTAKGTIDVSGTGTIHYDEHANNGAIDVHVEAGLNLTLEASVTIKAGVAGFVFSGGSVEGLIAENTYLVSAETGFTADFGLGTNFGRGPYIEASLSFSGLVAVGKHEKKVKGLVGGEKEIFRYTILKKPESPLLGGIYYFND